MHLRLQICPLRLAVAMAVTSVVLAACSGSDSISSGPSDGGPTAATTAQGGIVPDQVEASWAQIAVDEQALASDDTVEFAGVIPATSELPALVYGSLSVHGQGAHAATWAVDGTVGDLGLDNESTITDFGVAGSVTYLIGSVRENGLRTPFLLGSTDRATWERLPLPAEAIDRHVAFTAMAVPPEGSPVLLGLDADNVPVAVVPGAEGTVIGLPQPTRQGTLTSFTGAAANGPQVLAIATLEASDGSTRLVGYNSGDAGATWEVVGAPGPVGSEVSGMVVVAGRFVATGSHTVDTVQAPMAWSTEDGATWKRETAPLMAAHFPGLSSGLSEPSLDGDDVVSVIIDESMLYTTLLRREPDGTWQREGSTDPWVAPGALSFVGSDGGAAMVVARSWQGRGAIGLLDGSDCAVTSQAGAEPTIDDWNSIGLVGDEPSLVGYTLNIDVSDIGWSRSPVLTPYAIRENTLTTGEWQPAAAKRLADVAYLSDPNAGTLVIGTARVQPSAAMAQDGSDVMGWFRDNDSGRWKRAVGLAGRRAEVLGSVSRVGGTFVATGHDRASLIGDQPQVGAIWTSTNGWRWARAQGDFGLDAGPDTWVEAACEAPGGGVMAVGGADAPRGEFAPKIWKRQGQRWLTLDVSGLGRTTKDLFHCVGTDETTLLQGYGQTRDVTFRTDDGTTFEEMTIGGDRDEVGEIRQVGNGFAASGSVDQDGTTLPVVWLSPDGITWQPTVVPSERETSTSDVLERDGDLIVPLMSAAGPEVWVIENADELINALPPAD